MASRVQEFSESNTEKSWDPISSQFKPKGEVPGLWAKSQAHRGPKEELTIGAMLEPWPGGKGEH